MGENPKTKKRVRFSDQHQEEPGTSEGRAARLLQPEKFIGGDNKVRDWLQNQLPGRMSELYDTNDTELAAAVAATAFAIYSLEEEGERDRRKKGEDLNKSRGRNKEVVQEDATLGSRVIRLFSGTVKDAGEPSFEKQASLPHQRLPESIQPARIPIRSASIRPSNSADQTRRGSSSRNDVPATRADSWEVSQLRKINKRYEKMRSDIQAWENAKKMAAKLKMENSKNDFEERRTRNEQHYQNKVARIEMIAGGSRRQLEDKKRREESEVKEKAKYKRMKRKSRLNCFCC